MSAAYGSVSNTASWRGGGPSSTQNRRLSVAERLCRRRREQDRGKAGEIPSLNFHFFPVLFLLWRFTGGVCSQGSEVSCCAEDFCSRAAGAAEGKLYLCWVVSSFMVLRGLGGAASTNPHNKKVRYALIPIVIAAFVLLALFGIRGPSENIQYVGSPNGYHLLEASLEE